MRNGGMRNFDNPLYGPNSGAQTQTDANGVAVGTQAGHYDVPKSKKGKGKSSLFSWESLESSEVNHPSVVLVCSPIVLTVEDSDLI